VLLQQPVAIQGQKEATHVAKHPKLAITRPTKATTHPTPMKLVIAFTKLTNLPKFGATEHRSNPPNPLSFKSFATNFPKIH
jgi:hypothetical protein